MKLRLIQFCFILFVVLFFADNSYAKKWKTHKGKHFIVQVSDNVSDGWAKQVLREAENYYTTIARSIGFTRYHNFWTWEERVKIIIYSNKEEYVKKTGLPPWSRGGATTYHRQLKSRAIVSFKQEEPFSYKILPHEISHLILADFIGSFNIPLWFNEGVAQLQERGKKREGDIVMRKAVQMGYYIPMRSLASSDVRLKSNKVYVTFFYAQSVSVVNFMIEKYGSQRFGELCKQMKNGLSFERAMQKAYVSIFNSMEDLEEKWLYSMRN